MKRSEAKRALEERGIAHFRQQLAVQWVILAVALAALGCGVGYFLKESYEELLLGQGERLRHQTSVIEKNLSHQLDIADDTLKMVAKRYANRDFASSPGKRDDLLIDLDTATAGMRAFIILDREGYVVNSSRPDLVGRNFRNREYFRLTASDPDRSRLHILPPFKTIYGFYAMPVARAITGADGEFLGVVSVSLDPEFFTTLVTSVLFSPDMQGGIAHSSGSQFLLTPSTEEMIGNNLAVPASFFTRHVQSGRSETLLTGEVVATGQERLMAQRDVTCTKSPCDARLVVGISCDLKSIHAGWREVAAVLGSVYAALALSSVVGLAFYQRRQRQARGDLLERERELIAALTEVKTLSGLLPICSSCHKIRDDQGYWNILEKYICEHSGAEFTHGICPECIEKLYPEFKGKKEEG